MAFDKIIATYEEILELIPQKPPMVMIDRVLYAGKAKTITGLLIKEDNIFVMDGQFREAGLIETIAQTAAAGVGFQYKTTGEKPPVGYIGSVNKLKIHEMPAVNTLINTKITVDYEVFDFSIISGRVYSGDITFAECEMKIFLKKEGKSE